MDPAAREAMILSEQHTVRILAKMAFKRIRGAIALDDLMQYGQLGLIAAVDHYDGSVALQTYAKHRISGSILDGMRSEDYLTREHRREVNLLQQHEPASLKDTCIPHNVQMQQASGLRDPADNPEELAQATESQRRLVRAIGTLKPRLRFVAGRYLLDGRLLRQISSEMGVVESRASQLMKVALIDLQLVLGCPANGVSMRRIVKPISLRSSGRARISRT